MRKLKQTKGITLVALVITIIILLILAGISISALTNQGLFGRANEAKRESEIANIKEQIQLDIYEKQLEPPLGSITEEQLGTILGKYGTVNKEDGKIVGITTGKGYEILLKDIYGGGTVAESVPDGAIVNPVNDITTWLKTGEISKQYSYTTIEQVIADSTCTESLMNNENAMKYLARSTEFANAICASETTMTYLGQSTYVDNTVLNSDVWVTAIKTSSYKWSVLEFPVYPWATASDEDIIKMINAYYDGDITIDDIKTKNSVGDTRSVTLSAMKATGVSESHREQIVQFVIGDFEHDDLTTSINGKTKACMTLIQKDCLMDAANQSNPTNGSGNTENGYINSTITNVGSWRDCARRTWCNNIYFNSLPENIRNLIKEVKKLTSAGSNSSTIVTTNDKIFLASDIEILGTCTYTFSGEGTQYQYYKNSSVNRIKLPTWDTRDTNIYLTRSPVKGNSAHWCIISSSGGSSASDWFATTTFGISPNFCI